MNLSPLSNSMHSGEAGMFAGYQILGEISRGGMGVVYRVRHPELNREMALKVILKPSSDPRLAERFKREAQTLGQLRHPNILNVSDFGYEKGAPYLVMDFIEGEDLEAVLKRAFREQGEVDLDWLIPKLKDLASALAHCHQAGVTHRDLKPANVLLQRETERLILIDFGLVKQEAKPGSDSLADLSLTGEMLGTPEYMSPEQFDASGDFGKPGPACDVWSFGVFLYYCLTGEKPFKGDSVYNYCVAVIKNDPAPFKARNRNCPRLLSDLVKDCLRKDPRDRPTMEEVEECLDDSLQGLSGLPSSSPMKYVLAGVLVLSFLAVGLFVFLNRDNVAPDIVWDTRPERLYNGQMVLSGGVTEPDCILLLDGKRVAIENWRFHVKVPLTFEGKSFAIELTDPAGNSYKDEVFLKRSGVRVAKDYREGGFRSIAEALKGSPKEVIIEVEPGEYVESIVLKEGRTIVASSSSKPVVWRSKKGPCLVVKGGKTLLRGLTLKGVNKDRGLVVESGQVTLESVILSAQGDIGISVTGINSLLQAKDCVIERCAKLGVYLSTDANGKLQRCKIRKSGNCNVVVQGRASVVLEDCEISKAGEKGLFLFEATLLATNCNFTENNGLGLRITKDSQATLNNCRVMNTISTLKKDLPSHFNGSGLSFGVRGTLDLESCQFSNNAGEGLVLEVGAGVAVVKNSRASSNFLNGFCTLATPDTKFISCKAEDNRVNGFVILYKSKVSFDGCESKENGNDGFLVRAGASGTFTSCKAYNNKSSGIAAAFKKSWITARNCEANGNKYGFFITNDSEMAGTGLTAKDNGANGLVVQAKSLVKLFQSTIMSNKLHDLCLLTGSELIAENSVFEQEGPRFLYKDKDSKITIRGD
ncbi:MAG: protein kinase [Planctomycetota bacterium]|nr:protein kinase [Planctomycetota bacterium]